MAGDKAICPGCVCFGSADGIVQKGFEVPKSIFCYKMGRDSEP